MNGINVVKTNMKDCDSFNIEVFTNDGNLIATGSLMSVPIGHI